MRAAVLGSPIAHSKSPPLHRAAYAVLGLHDWTYDRIECTAEQLPALVGGFGREWVGVSVTMPGKVAALEFAHERTERAVLAGSANTLIRTAAGWRADCTDVDGVRGALEENGIRNLTGRSVVVIGAGGTARPAVIALAALGAASVTVVARSELRSRETLACAQACGLDVAYLCVDDLGLADVASRSAVVVSTVPAVGVAPVAEMIANAPVVLDAIYDPWPTPLAQAVQRAGGTVVSGLEMLLNQAYGQVEQFTSLPAPRRAMRAALDIG
ncbi:MAG: shikimate dehydrogenase [Rhodococcus sp. (in: high G+C Gram-positive bacteria)]